MPDHLLLKPHDKDLGGWFIVRRLLPAAARQAVGPFLFFDHFGPTLAHPDDNHDVRPHPHIGLSTVTYLFEGAMVHRDSTGITQRIEPGAINWMTAGRGIVHSERAPDDLRATSYMVHGLQLWTALPEADEEIEPAFAHTAASAIPSVVQGGAVVRVLVGEAFGVVSPVQARSPTLYLDITLSAGARLALPALAPERALYGVDSPYAVDGITAAPREMVVLTEGETPLISAEAPARLVLIGGAPLGHRHMWWNFVSSRRERIVQAADDWAEQRMGQVPGEIEFIPLPEKRPI